MMMFNKYDLRAKKRTSKHCVGCSSIQPKKEEKVQKHKKKSFLPEGPEETRSFFQDINGNPSFRSENFLTTFHPSKRDKISNCIDSLLPKQDKTLSKLKSKRSKLNTENNNVVLAESIAGYRGHEPVDSLVAYITGNTDPVPNSDILHPKPVFGCLDVEQKREKIVNKDYKNLTNNKDLFVDSTKKKHLGVDENNHIDNEEHKQVLTDQCGNLLNIPYSNCAKELVTQDAHVVSSVSVEDQPCVKYSGNVEAELNRVAVTSFSSGLDTSGRQELSSFVKDFYSVTEGHSELIEDSDFHVVKKKRKKYRQTKKFLSSFRRYNYVAGESRERDCNSDQTARNNSLTLNLPISQQGSDKPDHTCWKHASSVPHSEHSSPENSDLDSVHSLPIHISPTLNSTVVPSFSLSSSHASYAEIARLSSSNKSKLNSIPANKSMNSYLLPEVHSQKSCKLGPQVSENVGLELNFGVELSILNSTSVYPLTHSEQAQFSSNSNVSNLEKTSELKPNKIVDKVTSNATDNLFGKDKKREKIETTIIDGIPQIYSSSMTVKHTNLSSGPVVLGFSENNDVTKTKESSNIDGCSLNKTMAIRKIMKKVKKLDLNGRKQQFSEEMSHNLPVIIMDNCLPSGNVCGLTFGFEINELLVQMALDKATNQDGIIKSEDTTVEKLSKAGDPSHNPLEAQNLQKQVPVNSIHSLPNHDISQSTYDEASSPGQVTIPSVPCKQDPISGPSPQWIEPQENPKCFNYDQIVSFFGLAWENVQKEYQKDASDDNRAACNKIKYYSK
ncbi:uncharacterized protein LOC143255558 isoform X2 [Tachypleus tridentatus]|uniref:uncharacterized protein LOC143255558 isoform X2 n=1 Tax=Tachypleus tridentatus TaxID=6853 RepID=UPI003FD376D7